MTAPSMGRSLIGLLAAAALSACSAPPSGPKTDHFDGQHFFNPDGEQGTGGEQQQGPFRVLLNLISPPDRSWPEHVRVRPSRPPARVAGTAMLVTWVGHSTVLVQTEDLNILTDPVWAERASPVIFAGVKRVREPGIRLTDLPKIDLILLSHNHYDHLDAGTLHTLWLRDRPLIVTGLGTTASSRDMTSTRSRAIGASACPSAPAST